MIGALLGWLLENGAGHRLIGLVLAYFSWMIMLAVYIFNEY